MLALQLNIARCLSVVVAIFCRKKNNSQDDRIQFTASAPITCYAHKHPCDAPTASRAVRSKQTKHGQHSFWPYTGTNSVRNESGLVWLVAAGVVLPNVSIVGLDGIASNWPWVCKATQHIITGVFVIDTANSACLLGKISSVTCDAVSLRIYQHFSEREVADSIYQATRRHIQKYPKL
jgi:hypothetical protein